MIIFKNVVSVTVNMGLMDHWLLQLNGSNYLTHTYNTLEELY